MRAAHWRTRKSAQISCMRSHPQARSDCATGPAPAQSSDYVPIMFWEATRIPGQTREIARVRKKHALCLGQTRTHNKNDDWRYTTRRLNALTIELHRARSNLSTKAATCSSKCVKDNMKYVFKHCAKRGSARLACCQQPTCPPSACCQPPSAR